MSYPTPARDDQILANVQAALRATNEFDAVILTKLPEETAFPASGRSAAYVLPYSYDEQSRHFDNDGPTYRRTVRYQLVIATRNADQVCRDAELSRLDDVCQNALTGINLGAQTLPAWTKCGSGRYQTPNAPERRMIDSFMIRRLRSKRRRISMP